MFVTMGDVKPKKVLVIRFSSIGDIVLTTPVIRGLRRQLGAEVHVLTKEAYRDMMAANPYVSRVITLQKRLADVTTKLKRERYDLVVDLHHNLRSLLVKMALKRPAVSFRKLNPEKWLLTQWKINRLPDVHIVDRYLDTVRPFGVRNDGQGLDFFIPPERRWDASGIRSFFPNTKDERPLLTIAVGAALQTKRIPNNKLATVAQLWPGPVALLGGPAEREDGAYIARKSGRDDVINFCGETDLFQSASLIAHSHKLLTPDTGMMHIAAALGTPTVSVWGNTVPAFGMTPYPPSDIHRIIEIKALSCRPCSKIGYNECPKKHFRCMRDIPTDQLINALLDG